MDVNLFVGNPDVYAEQQADGTYLPTRVPITDELLMWHMDGRVTVGTYVLQYDKARFFAFDIDDQDIHMARSLATICRQQGFAPGIEFSGRKGYHVWVLLDQWYPAVDVKHVADHIAQLAGFNGEVFPKQTVAKELGNLIKLPLGVHRVTGVRSRFLSEPAPAAPSVFTQALVLAPSTKPQTSGKLTEFERPCLHSMQVDPPGEGERNHAMYQFVALMRRAGLEGLLLTELAFYFNATFTPPLPDSQVDSILDTTDSSYGPICDRLRADRRCGDQCVMQKFKGLGEGLHIRPGDVKHAAVGDTIVVRLGDKVPGSNSVYIEHPDVNKGIVQYRRGERP